MKNYLFGGPVNVGLFIVVAAGLTGCFGAQPASGQDEPIISYLTGSITVNSEIDTTANYADFEVIVARSRDAGIDTLAYAVTDRDGHFATDISAERRGVFALLIKRLGNVLSTTEIVVADGDTVQLKATFPLGSRLPQIRSEENAAWLAFRNTEAQHSEQVVAAIKEGEGDENLLGISIRRTADLLWGLQETFPGTLGAAAAAARSVIMLEGWNDSLVVDRSSKLPGDAPGFVEAIRAAHRVVARTDGLDEAISVVERAMTRTEARETLAALEATVVQAHLDSLQSDMAAVTARSLQQSYEGSLWAVWAQRAEYEAKNLMPGMQAPVFETVTRSDTTFSLDSLFGKTIVLEFWDPQDATYREQAPQIAALAEELGNDVQWVSAALNPDIDLIDAFFEGRNMPGVKLQDTSYYQSEIARLYNVNTLPTRYVIRPDGTIFKKYVGDAFLRMAEDLRDMIE